MLYKMYLGEVLLFFIVAIYGHVNGRKPIKLVLENAKDIQSVQTPKYPRLAGPFLSISWLLYAPYGFRLQLDCPEIKLTKKKPEGVLLLWDGSRHIDIGLSGFTRGESAYSYMKLELKTGWSHAQINCSVRLIRIEVEVREAPDSRELGFGSQERSTSCPCGWTNKANKKRIVGGRGALPNEFVFVAYLRCLDDTFKNDYYMYCTGSILTQRHILTAAHCFMNYPEVEREVVVGGHDLVDGSPNGVNQTIKINKAHVHDDYKKTDNLNDIAIIELIKDIKFSQFVGPVCLPSESYSLVGEWVKALGWGKLYTTGPVSRTLRTVNLGVVDMEECKEAYPYLAEQKTKLCFYSPKGDVCAGDSGGPLVYYDAEIDRYVQVASVVSTGQQCYSGQPATGMNVFLYLDWIKGVIASDTSGLPKEKICQKV